MPRFGKTVVISALTSSILSLSALSAENTIPEPYKFVPQDSLMAFDIKTGNGVWDIISKNKSLNKIDIFKELNKTQKSESVMDALFEENTRKNIGNNIIVSFSNFNFEKNKDLGIVVIEEMKDANSLNLLKNRIFEIANKSKEFKREDSKFRDTEIINFVSTKKDKDNSNRNNYFAFINNYLIASDNKEQINNSLASFYDEKVSLIGSSEFAKSYDKLGNNYQLQFYLNNKKFFSSIYDSKDMKKALKDINFNYNDLMSANSSLFNFNLNSNGLHVKTYSLLDKNNKLAKSVLESKSSSFKKYTNMVPKNTILFLSSSDIKNAGQNILDILPKSKDMDFEKLSTEAIGINIIDSIKNLQDDFAIAVFNTESSPLIPGFALMMTPKDRTKLVTALNSLKIPQDKKDKGKRNQKAAKPPLELKFNTKSNYKSVDIFTANEIPDMAEVGIQPSYGFINNDVILASNETVLKSIIDRNATPTVDYTLQGNDSFKKLINNFGEENNGLGFLNLSTIVNMVSPFMQKNKDLKDTLTELKKFEAIGFNRSNDDDGVFGNFVLMADVENIAFDKIIPKDAMPKEFKDAENRAMISSVKANMHTTQTMVETYAVDWKGFYPDNIESLNKEAINNKTGIYWKDLINPMTKKTGLGKNGSLINYSTYNSMKSNSLSLKGSVVYQPLDCKIDKTAKRNLCKSYKIYGLDNKGKTIKDKGSDFYLTNF